MTSTQKVIKYCALAFAIFLIISIVTGIASIGYEVLSGVGAFGSKNNLLETAEVISNESDTVSTIYIDAKSTNITVQKSTKLSIETNNKDIKYENKNGVVTIKDKSSKWFGRNKDSILIINIPEGIELDKFNLDAGAGKIEVSALKAKDLDLSLGAGSVTLNNLVISKNTKIDGGAGSVTIDNSILNNVDFDLGVGKTTINAYMYGNSDIDAGIGEVNINLFGDKSLYKLKVEKGIGSVYYNNEKVGDITIGEGVNFIDIDGGIGSIKISTN